MAIAIDAVSSGNVELSTTLSVAHVCSGTNRVLVVATECNGIFLQSLTYAGDAMTKITNDDPAGGMELWYLINPDTGSNNIVATLLSSGYIKICAASYTGVAQTGFPDNESEFVYSGTPTADLSVALTPVADGCWVVGCSFANTGAGDVTGGTGTTTRANELNASGAMGLCDNNAAVSPAASTTLVFSAPSSGRSALILSMEPAAGASGPANVKTVGPTAIASVKTVGPTAIADVKTINGLD